MELLEALIPEESGANMQLADPYLLQTYKLLEERTIWVDTEIDESLLNVTRQIMLWNMEDQDIKVEDRIPIKICIFSPGGNLAETMHACSVMQMSKTPVYTYNMGTAMSGGVMLLIAGHKGHRYTLPYARAMAHQGSGMIGGTAGQAKDAMDDYQAQINDMINFIIDNTNITKQQFSKKKDRDWYMGAEDMVKYGVVDHIVTNISEIIG